MNGALAALTLLQQYACFRRFRKFAYQLILVVRCRPIILVLRFNLHREVQVVGIGEAVIENPDIEVTAGGGLLCGLFGAAGGALSDMLLAPFAETVNQLVDSLRDDLIGLEICE